MMSSMTPAATAAPLKPCTICGGESCIVIPSIAAQEHLCLLHYYTTGVHRRPPRSASAATATVAAKKKSASLLVENDRMNRQLPQVQDIFAEAFVELQKEIGEESARSFQSAANAEDPLGMMLGGSTPAPSSTRPLFRKPPRRRDVNFSSGKKVAAQRKDDSMEGGFIRETVLPERLRNPNVSFEGFASQYDNESKTMSRKRPAPSSSGTSANKSANPYQRKNKPTPNIWNAVLDSNKDDRKAEKRKITYADMEKEMISNITSGSNASTKTCTCGSNNVEISGAGTSKNNDMTKGEVWGNKDRADVVERCHCLACGKRWNEE